MEVTWLPFELHPDFPPEGVLIADYFGSSPAQLAQMHAGLKQRAAELGRPMNPPDRAPNTHAALALSEYVRDHAPDKLAAVHHAFFRAYFVEQRNLGARETLVHVCEQTGVDAAAALAAVDAGTYDDRLADTMAQAHRLGVTGAPTFIINNRYKIVGAQPYEPLRDALRRIQAETE